VSGERRKYDNPHLHMSLLEFPLHFIQVPNIETGLDRDDGLGIPFLTRGSFVLEVHGERDGGAEVVGEGRNRQAQGEGRLIC